MTGSASGSSWAQMLRTISLIVLGVFFIAVGFLHFLKPEPFVQIVPSLLPQPLLLVWISGVGEILGGAMLLFQKTRSVARNILIALLLAVFPANINMAVNSITFDGAVPEWALWARLPLQFVLIAWLWWAAARSEVRR